MADVLTKSQQDVDNAIAGLTDEHRTFAKNYGEALTNQTRGLLYGIFVATATGLAFGGLVGAVVGYRRG